MHRAAYLQTFLRNAQYTLDRSETDVSQCVFPQLSISSFSLEDVILATSELTGTSEGCCELPRDMVKHQNNVFGADS